MLSVSISPFRHVVFVSHNLALNEIGHETQLRSCRSTVGDLVDSTVVANVDVEADRDASV